MDVDSPVPPKASTEARIIENKFRLVIYTYDRTADTENGIEWIYKFFGFDELEDSGE